MTHRIQIDSISVTEDEARELMFHHLLLAQRFFEALDDDPKEYATTMSELKRILGHDLAAFEGARAFIVALSTYYDDLAQKQGE